MNYILLSVVIAYEVILIFGLGLWLAHRRKQAEDRDGFALAGRSLPLPAVAITLALTVLGAAHILGIFEMAWFVGAVAVWFGIAHVLLLTVVCLVTGLWVRRMGVSTIPEILQNLYGIETRLLVSCVMAGNMFGILTLEAQGLGIIFSAMTDWDIKTGAMVGGFLGISYVILAGMREIGWLNVINATVMYIGLILATIFLAFRLPGGTYDTVATYYETAGEPHMTSIYGTPGLFMTFAVGITIALLFSQATNQMLLQVTMSADSDRTVRRALWIAAPVNGLFAVFAVTIGLAAKSVPEFNALGPKVAATAMLVEYLPQWLSALLLASFLAAILSTFAILALASSTLFSMDIYKTLFKPEATEREVTRVTRLLIVGLGVIAIAIASYLPPILVALSWLLAWLVPVFWLVVFGLFWKRNQPVAIATLVIAWVINSAWSFTSLPALVGLQQLPNAYITLIVTLVVLIGGNLLMEGRPAYFKSDGAAKSPQAAG